GAAHGDAVAELPPNAAGDGAVHAVGIDPPDRLVAELVDVLVPDEDPERTFGHQTASVLDAAATPTGSRLPADSTAASIIAMVPRLFRPEVSDSRPSSMESANSSSVPHGPVHSIGGRGTLRGPPPRGVTTTLSLATSSSLLVHWTSPCSNSSLHSPAHGVIGPAATQLPR